MICVVQVFAPEETPRRFILATLFATFCVRVARLPWLQIDTCYIDRSNRAGLSGLSEAVNSMFAWHSQGHVCYTYLYGVPRSGSLHGRAYAFRTSRWFSRGWTLQELMGHRARSLVFLSQDWTEISTEAGLAFLLEETTSIEGDHGHT